ncbi:cytochrome P450 [Lentinula lateritia]|uniref:Cytochrome P450 n=1 Tax=Lentinula aff. lateritia TaxID=2804960 RepID=A0ACC1U0N0_9AGAR|nr:cytochrome P450 [Lentinula aff. lateritia]KAJ3854338.1 cytochrome P450 [Lentinula lateritia]
MLDLKYLDMVVGTVAIYCVYRLMTLEKRALSLPPGPRGFPLIGNLFDVPAEREWLTFAKWGETYGKLASVTVLGQPLIIVNSASIAKEMLDKNSAIYSDRPVIPMGGELCGWKNTLVLVPYGERFRNYRRLAHQLFGNAATMKSFHPVEELETHRFLKRLLSRPAEFSDHIRKTAGAIILRISHGYEVGEGEDPFVTLADKATEQFALSTTPGFLVNLVPFLQYLPDWFPGASFKQTAKEWSATLNEMVDLPYDYVKRHIAAGSAEPSYVSKLVEGQTLSPEQEFEIKWSSASLYSGGADTTVSAIYSFFKAMAMYPEVQVRAQAELDAVVGVDRLPSFEDRDHLPYIQAVTLEALRWHSVVPTSVPHRVTEDNVFNGYFIPKGALVLSNIWQMNHDPEVYHDPMSFIPERFMGPKPEMDPREACFGFGRRPIRRFVGRVLADASVFISCAMALAVFNISKYSENGVVIEPDMDQSTATDSCFSHPSSFKCTISPRSDRAVALIQADERR